MNGEPKIELIIVKRTPRKKKPILHAKILKKSLGGSEYCIQKNGLSMRHLMWQSQQALLLEKSMKMQSLWRLDGEGGKKTWGNLEFKILQPIEKNIERHIILPSPSPLQNNIQKNYSPLSIMSKDKNT